MPRAEYLVGTLEPLLFRLSAERFRRLSYVPWKNWLREQEFNLSDLQNMNLPSQLCSIPALRKFGLRGEIWTPVILFPKQVPQNRQATRRKVWKIVGGEGEIWTRIVLFTRQTLWFR